MSVDCGTDPKLIAIELSSREIHEYEPLYPSSCTELMGSPTEDDVFFTWQGGGALRRYRVVPSLLPIPQPPTLTLEAETTVPDLRDAVIGNSGERLYLASEGSESFAPPTSSRSGRIQGALRPLRSRPTRNMSPGPSSIPTNPTSTSTGAKAGRQRSGRAPRTTSEKAALR